MSSTARNVETEKKTRVLIIDDSALIRKLLRSIFEKSPEIEVVDTAFDAQDARQKIKRYNPDVITLDIEMPGMDGLSFLEKIMKLRPMPVVMCSTLTKRGAKETIRALEIGAVDFVPKPEVDVQNQLNAYADQLIDIVLTASKIKFKNKLLKKVVATETLPAPQRLQKNYLVAIGSSTGGTQALEKILTELPKNSPPIVIAQHIPKGFSSAFCERVNELTQVNVKEACDGEEILRGYVYMAPGGEHMRIVNNRGRLFCEIFEEEGNLHRHKPSVDVLMASIAENVKKKAIGIMLTGMGKDGAEGMKKMYDAGLHTLAQDEKSSLVWGMPKQAIDLGGVNDVINLDDVAQAILDLAF